MATKAASKQAASPQRPTPNVAAYIFGGLFLGVWFYGLFFTFGNEWTSFNYWTWFFWGILGFVIAGGLYAARIANDVVRIVIFVLVGISIMILILAAALEEEAHIIATFTVATGAGLIASALPRIEHH